MGFFWVAFRKLFLISRAPAVQQSLQNSACLGQHQGGLPFSLGPWLKSEAPALQAVLSGSVTRRTPPILIAGNSTMAQREAS